MMRSRRWFPRWSVSKRAALAVSVAAAIFGWGGFAEAAAASTPSLLQSAHNDFRARKYASASAKYETLLGRNLPPAQLGGVLVAFCESAMREGRLGKAESLTVFARGKLTDPAALSLISFLRGEALYFSGDMQGSQEEYMDFLSGNAQSPFANDAIDRLLVIDENGGDDGRPLVAFAHAEFLEFSGARDSALITLRQILSNFPGAKVLDEATMKIGDILSEQGKFNDAIAEYRSLEGSFPKSGLVPVARLKIARLYSGPLGDSKQAASEFENIITAFPGTSFATEARNELQALKVGVGVGKSGSR